MGEHRVTIRVPEEADSEHAGEELGFPVEASTSILGVARSRGLWLPADCQVGWCTTCAARLLSGDVDHERARRYYPEDEAAGFVLTCVARPSSDVVLRSHQQDAMLAHRAEHDLPPGAAKREG
jgi:ferredoxin